jgi:SnoaL-like domain
MAAVAADSEIRMVLEQMVEAQNAGDPDRFLATLAMRPDALHIGSDPDEWWTAEELSRSLNVGVNFGIKLVMDDVSVHAETEDVAWAVGRGHFENEAGKSRPMRMSAVLIRAGDGWKVVHLHASIGVPNDELFG